MGKEEIIVTVKPLFDETKEKVCICCPKAHIFSYNINPNRFEISGIMTDLSRRSDDQYKKRKFRVTIEELKEGEL